MVVEWSWDLFVNQTSYLRMQPAELTSLCSRLDVFCRRVEASEEWNKVDLTGVAYHLPCFSEAAG